MVRFGGGFTVSAQCASYPVELFIQNNASQELFPCYKPWVNAPDGAPGYCGIGCPVQLVPTSTYHGVAVMTGVFAWSSYVITLVVGLTMIWIPRYRRFPACMILFCCLVAHLGQLSGLVLLSSQ